MSIDTELNYQDEVNLGLAANFCTLWTNKIQAVSSFAELEASVTPAEFTWAMGYHARLVACRPIPCLEYTIFKEPREAVAYIKKFGIYSSGIKERIRHNPTTAVNYAMATKQPQADMQKVISLCQDASYMYALKVLKSRFYAGEEVILLNPVLSWSYMVEVLGVSTWPKAEETFKRDPDIWELYLEKNKGLQWL